MDFLCSSKLVFIWKTGVLKSLFLICHFLLSRYCYFCPYLLHWVGLYFFSDWLVRVSYRTLMPSRFWLLPKWASGTPFGKQSWWPLLLGYEVDEGEPGSEGVGPGPGIQPRALLTSCLPFSVLQLFTASPHKTCFCRYLPRVAASHVGLWVVSKVMQIST